MSAVRIHRPKYALAAMLRKPGGKTVAEAVEAADANLEGLKEAAWPQLDAGLADVEACFARYGEAFDETLIGDHYQKAVGLIGLPSLCGLDALENAAHSLCDLLDRLRTTGKWDRDGIKVHIQALRLLRTLPPGEETAAAPILDGLRRVRERHAILSAN
ncbi:hypothetical protein [Phenylobacterium sp.]|uniref:hypothetical protein n=1 Tax=Phenylobacterium sp. TaxID=1871053 RepID=UPI00185735D4|nr:hypothetical protein [Phenylobacterium sp.]MBA4794214.1 hypothetical protein [Phenylobacterium sp.]MBC7168693.1 hypothetical protein [Phenylobacterium sp.]